ncbi:hypothetical protein NX801_28115 [Streptomyces sp. LP05-1]|uniref:AAA+ ATPase domain-containing protein n=1 Tax=Streptomyces pyxinae TaxID=2970734 RepID=A0ABT2CPQ9_9ACTN|nr:hypothetical protein [Streptomyces sp. LP05-1]MCS0639430.1 hypothetical protein [Streptomyces sp. LP05-1]
MDRELYGREAVLDGTGLIARLTGLTPYHFARTAYEHGDDPPVTVFTGGRGLGKTALLKQIRNAYRGGTPLALLDCAGVVPPADHGPGWSPVTGALAELAVQLSARVYAARPVEFPRLALGLAAVTGTGWSQGDDERVRRDLQRLGPVLATVDEAKGAAGVWVAKVLSKLAATAAEAGAPLAGLLAEATVETVLEEVFGRYQRKSRAWYGSYRNAGGHGGSGGGELGLHRLAVDFGGGRRAEAEGFLVNALLEDLRQAYLGLTRRGTRRGRPLILLDNAHLPLGRRLVEPVLRERAAGRRDQTVIVAASRERDHEGLRRATRLRLPEVAHRAPCPRGAEIGSGVLAVGLTPLSAAHTRALCEGYDPPGRAPAALPDALHRLTGGRPLGVALLGRALGQVPEDERPALTPAALLDLTLELREDSPAVPVAPALLAELLPGPPPDALAVLAAARDEESARMLARARLRAESDDGDMALRARDALRADGWPDGPGHFVADPLLRALLLHRLRFHDGDGPGYAAWRAVHETLRSRYGPAPTPYRLREDLALGRPEEAVTELCREFQGPDVTGWLGRLRLIATAPYPREHGHPGPDPRRAVALGREPGGPQPEGLDEEVWLHLCVRRLLHALWLLTDPLALPDEEVVERLAHELRQLSGRHLTGTGPLWEAATHWPRDIRAWREPSLPPGRGDGV